MTVASFHARLTMHRSLKDRSIAPRDLLTVLLFHEHLNRARIVGSFSSVLKFVDWIRIFHFSLGIAHEVSSIAFGRDYNFCRCAQEANFQSTRMNHPARIHSREVQMAIR
jgi:hypothetical protein